MSEHKHNKKLRHHRKRNPWPLIVLSLGALILVFGLASTLRKPSQPKAAIEVSGSPSLKVDHQRVDLGDVKLGQTVDVKFQLMNVGDQTLRFTKTPFVEVVEGC
jgi:hypothetical protein